MLLRRKFNSFSRPVPLGMMLRFLLERGRVIAPFTRLGANGACDMGQIYCGTEVIQAVMEGFARCIIS